MFGLVCFSLSKTVASDSLLMPPVALAVDVVLEVVTMELPELDMQVRGRCFTELLGLIVLRPRNFIA